MLQYKLQQAECMWGACAVLVELQCVLVMLGSPACVSSVVWRLCCGAPVLLSAAVRWNSRLLSFLPWPLPTDPHTPTGVSADKCGRGRGPDSIMRWFCMSFQCSYFTCFSGLIWELSATYCQSGSLYWKCLPFECSDCLPVVIFPAIQGQLYDYVHGSAALFYFPHSHMSHVPKTVSFHENKTYERPRGLWFIYISKMLHSVGTWKKTRLQDVALSSH